MDTPGRLLVPGWMSDQRSCTTVPDPINWVLTSPRQGNWPTLGSVAYLDRLRVIHNLQTWVWTWYMH